MDEEDSLRARCIELQQRLIATQHACEEAQQDLKKVPDRIAVMSNRYLLTMYYVAPESQDTSLYLNNHFLHRPSQRGRL